MGSKPKATDNAQQYLNQKIEPAWQTNQRYDNAFKTIEKQYQNMQSYSNTVIPEQYNYFGNVKQVRDTMNINDIKGTNVGSKNYTTMKSQRRMINPLEPQYNYPGSKEIQEQLDLYNRLQLNTMAHNQSTLEVGDFNSRNHFDQTNHDRAASYDRGSRRVNFGAS